MCALLWLPCSPRRLSIQCRDDDKATLSPPRMSHARPAVISCQHALVVSFHSKEASTRVLMRLDTVGAGNHDLKWVIAVQCVVCVCVGAPTD